MLKSAHPDGGVGVGARADNMPSPADLNQLSDDLLQLILSFVPARTLVARCRLVCRRWRELIGRPTLWKLQWERDPAYRAALDSAQRAPGLDWCLLSVLQPLERNLVKNPCGEEQDDHWRTRFTKTRCFWDKSMGHDWEDQPSLASCDRWRSQSQVVNLLEQGLWEDLLDSCQPDIVISDWWDNLHPTGCEYWIEVTLLAADETSVIMRFKAHQKSTSQRNAAGFLEVSHVFRNYGPGVRYVRFWHKGRHAQSWTGSFGVRFMKATVLVKMSQEPR